jgi:hypothetical protein
MIIFLTTLTACGGEVITTVDPLVTTIPNNEDPEINKFAEVIESSNEYSYKILFKTTTKADNTTETFTYKFAKSGVNNAFSMVFEEDETIFLVSETIYYMITIIDGEKSAIKMVLDETYEDTSPDFTFLTDFNSYYEFEKKTENVMVGNIKTTCYEYNYLGITYKYYINANEYVIKVEYEDSEEKFTMEILDLKTTNIDKTILTIPTEAAGYTIVDYTDI